MAYFFIVKTRKCGNYCCIATCMQPRTALELARTHSHSLAHLLACTISHSTERSHSLAVARIHQNSFTLPPLLVHLLVCIHSHLLARLLARTLSNSLELAHSLALVRTRLSARWIAFANSLTFFWTCSLGAAKPFSFHCLPLRYSSNKSICYVATNFCENILISVRDMITKRNWKECPLVVEFNFCFQFLHVPVFQDLHMCHRAKFQWNQTIHDWAVVS